MNRGLWFSFTKISAFSSGRISTTTYVSFPQPGPRSPGWQNSRADSQSSAWKGAAKQTWPNSLKLASSPGLSKASSVTSRQWSPWRPWAVVWGPSWGVFDGVLRAALTPALPFTLWKQRKLRFFLRWPWTGSVFMRGDLWGVINCIASQELRFNSPDDY